MKAYMSDETSLRSRATWRDGAPGACKAACVEARAILAEAEPHVPCRDVFNVGRTSNTDHSNIGPLAMTWEPYKALAESLTAFVALEIS